MRLCLFTPTFFPKQGGAEFVVDTLARGLSDRGHRVVVLAPHMKRRHHATSSPPSDTLPYPVVRYRRPPLQHLWPELLSGPLARLHRREGFDAVLAFYSYPCGFAAARLKARLGLRLVVSPHGSDLYPNFHARHKPRVMATIRRGYRDADRIVSISRWITQRLHEVVGEPLPPIDLVPNGIDLAQLDADLQAADADLELQRDPPAAQPFVLQMCRLSPVKRVDLAIGAVRQHRAWFAARNLRWIIAGSGSEQSALQDAINAADLQNIIRLVGYVSGPRKAWLLRHATLFATTSREEGMPLGVLEAVAAGKPILASDILPHRELIEPLGVGRLFAAGDPEDLGTQLATMLDHDDPCALGRRAYEQRDRFGLARMIDGYERALDASAES